MEAQGKKEDRVYTYGDYITWPENERWEIIEGIAYSMTPGPSRRHQEISGNLFNLFRNHLEGKQCKVYYAPFDVRLPRGDEEDEEVLAVVQPDIVIYCDMSKLDERGGRGSPDLLIEIVSPSTASMDYIKKLNLYEKNGVKEYWIVHPGDGIVMVYVLTAEGAYARPAAYGQGDAIKVGLFEDLVISLESIFRE